MVGCRAASGMCLGCLDFVQAIRVNLGLQNPPRAHFLLPLLPSPCVGVRGVHKAALGRGGITGGFLSFLPPSLPPGQSQHCTSAGKGNILQNIPIAHKCQVNTECSSQGDGQKMGFCPLMVGAVRMDEKITQERQKGAREIRDPSCDHRPRSQGEGLQRALPCVLSLPCEEAQNQN